MRDPLRDAIRLLARADRSTTIVRSYLLGRGYSRTVIQSTLRALKKVGYLNDETTAHRLAERWLEHRPMGKMALMEALTTQGFSDETVHRAVCRVYQEITENAVADRYLRALPIRFQDPAREAHRRAALLSARGFSDSVVESLLATHLSDQDDVSC